MWLYDGNHHPSQEELELLADGWVGMVDESHAGSHLDYCRGCRDFCREQVRQRTKGLTEVSI